LRLSFPFGAEKSVGTPFPPGVVDAFNSSFLGYAGFLNSERLTVNRQPEIRRIVSLRNLPMLDVLTATPFFEVVDKRIN